VPPSADVRDPHARMLLRLMHLPFILLMTRTHRVEAAAGVGAHRPPAPARCARHASARLEQQRGTRGRSAAEERAHGLGVVRAVLEARAEPVMGVTQMPPCLQIVNGRWMAAGAQRKKERTWPEKMLRVGYEPTTPR
jgi:hypothetical protein